MEKVGEDISRLIEYFETDNRFDTDRIGLTGMSFGGSSTFYIAANNTKIKAAVPMIGYSEFLERWEHEIGLSLANEEKSRIIEQHMNSIDKMLSYIKKMDCYEKLIDFSPKPLLMICADKDIYCPKEYSVKQYRLLKPYYSDYPERLKIKRSFVNVNVINKIQAVNKLLGYSEIIIVPPSMLLEGEDDDD